MIRIQASPTTTKSVHLRKGETYPVWRTVRGAKVRIRDASGTVSAGPAALKGRKIGGAKVSRAERVPRAERRSAMRSHLASQESAAKWNRTLRQKGITSTTHSSETYVPPRPGRAGMIIPPGRRSTPRHTPALPGVKRKGLLGSTRTKRAPSPGSGKAKAMEMEQVERRKATSKEPEEREATLRAEQEGKAAKAKRKTMRRAQERYADRLTKKHGPDVEAAKREATAEASTRIRPKPLSPSEKAAVKKQPPWPSPRESIASGARNIIGKRSVKRKTALGGGGRVASVPKPGSKKAIEMGQVRSAGRGGFSNPEAQAARIANTNAAQSIESHISFADRMAQTGAAPNERIGWQQVANALRTMKRRGEYTVGVGVHARG